MIDSVQPSPAVPTKLFVKVTNKGTAASTPTNLKALRWVGNKATAARGTLVPAVLPGQSQVVLADSAAPSMAPPSSMSASTTRTASPSSTTPTIPSR